ncbi:MAG TPA: hypothetical protein VGO37_17355 [Steroidobacteraceae bacterium]|jgi:hypothetical protein|nr:hypothetical protein [Steroidobacteraceae bacterium]
MNAEQARRLAAVAGVLVVISIFAGSFTEVYVPGKLLVTSDPNATAANVAASPQLSDSVSLFILSRRSATSLLL